MSFDEICALVVVVAPKKRLDCSEFVANVCVRHALPHPNVHGSIPIEEFQGTDKQRFPHNTDVAGKLLKYFSNHPLNKPDILRKQKK
jgi:hypothetical protein